MTNADTDTNTARCAYCRGGEPVENCATCAALRERDASDELIKFHHKANRVGGVIHVRNADGPAANYCPACHAAAIDGANIDPYYTLRPYDTNDYV